MSLEGNLTAFGLSEILQLIAVQQKSGMLSVSRQDRSKVLFFREGQIVSTRDRRRRTKDPLKDYLTRYGIISRDDLIRIGQISMQSKLDLTDVIISEGFLDEETLTRHFRNHIQEEVHELLTWEQCSYKFIPGNDVIRGIKTFGEYSIEGMLMESMRRIDEFPAMLELLPDPNARISKVADPKDDQELSTNEKMVLGMLGKERNLAHLIANGKVPKFDVYEAIKHLDEKELIDIVVDIPDVPEEQRGRTRKRAKRRRRRANPVPVMIAIALFVAGLGWGARSVAPHVHALVAGVTVAKESRITRNRIEASLRTKLEAYRAMNGAYPPSLKALHSSGLATERFIDRVDAHSFRYQLTGGGLSYTLL